MIRELKNGENFNEVVESLDKVIVDFYAVWCGPCQMMSPLLHDLVEKNSEVNILKVNVDEFPEVAGRYGVMSIPTFVPMSKGIEMGSRKIGMATQEELLKMFNN